MVFWCYILSSALGFVIVLYGLLEIHYFLRMCLCVILARFIKKKTHILDMTNVTGICLTNDIDALLTHMNNARYLREIDFARVDFYERTKLYKTILSKGGSVFQGSATIRYRRLIRPFSFFQITSRVIYWDNQSIFMEHRFICPKDKFVHAISICRQRITDCNTEEIMETLLNTGTQQQSNNGPAVKSPTASDISRIEKGTVTFKPKMPLEISKWMEYNEISSAILRNGC